MDVSTWYWLIIGFEILSLVMVTTLELLNSRGKPAGTDPRVADIYSDEKHRASVAYLRDKTRLGVARTLFVGALTVAAYATGLFGRLDTWLVVALGTGELRTLAFFAAVMLAFDVLTVPFQLASTFGVEAKHGFNRTTPGTWIADKIKTWLVTAVVGGAILWGLSVFTRTLGQWFWPVFSALMVGFTLLFSALYTTIFVPIFNKLAPLPEGELRSAIEAYAAKVGFPVKGIFVMNASKRSTKSNAFFSGFGASRKIVLFDTLVQKHPVEEIVAVLAHEAGHAKGRHALKGAALSSLTIIALTWTFSLFVGSAELSFALGAEIQSLPVNLYAFFTLFAPISMILGLATSAWNRAHEYQADRFAAETTSPADMGAALKRLSSDNLSDLYPHPAYVAFHYSHPPLLKRLDAIEAVARAGASA